MRTSCTQLHKFYVANESRESETSTNYNLYAFICHFIFQSATITQYLAIYCNMQYIDTLYWPYVTGPARINHVSANYTELYFCQYLHL